MAIFRKKRLFFNISGVALSVVFLYFCLHSLDMRSLKDAFLLPRPWLLFAVVALNFVLMALRTVLWAQLINPIRKLPFWTLFDLLHIGYMANNLLPFKAGEFFRASFVAKKWKLPYAQVLTSIGLERYVSGVSLIVLLLIVASFLKIPTWLQSGAYLLGAILIVAQITLNILWKKKPNIENWRQRHPIIYHLIATLSHIGEGAQPISSYRSLMVLVLISLLTWVVQAFMLQIIQIAFQVDLSFIASLFVVIAVNLAVALPSAPANLGTFEFATVLAFTFLGIDKATSLGMGVYFHFLQTIPITLVGLFYYFRWGLRLKDIEVE